MPWEENKVKVALMVFPKMTVQQHLWNVLEHNHLALIKNNEETPATRKLAE